MAALVILTVYKHTAHTGGAHLAKGDFLRSAGEGGHGPLKRQPLAHAIELGKRLCGRIDHHALDHGGMTEAVFKFSFWDVDFRKQNSRRTSSD
jgi:hypothetical protein